MAAVYNCLLYTSDAADEEDSVDLGGRRIIKKTHEDIFHLDHGNSKKTIPGEILPNNDMFKFVRDFEETENTEAWGWQGYNLKNYTI